MVLLRYVFPDNYSRNQSRHTSFYDPFCDKLETISVFLVVTLTYGEVEAITSVYLNVNEPWAGRGRQVSDRWCR